MATAPIIRRRIAYAADKRSWRNRDLVDRAEVNHLRKSLAGSSREDVAAGVQRVCEEEVVAFVSDVLAATGERRVAVAGGVFANVRLNQRIRELPGVDALHVFPHMGDGGISVGAALGLRGRRSTSLSSSYRRAAVDHVYLGPCYSQKEIETTLSCAGLAFSVHEDIEEQVGGLLAQGYVACRFDGRMEYGPRALGNRSILCAPSDPSVHDWLNAALKRSEFMPFAPSALEEAAPQCFLGLRPDNRSEHHFMTATYTATSWCRGQAPAVVHVDGTARPQIVSRETSPSLHRILTAFELRTGLPLVINTSFNMHESPIVNTPDDAVRAFLQSGLHYLAMGKALARNPRPAWPKARVATTRAAAPPVA